MLPPRFALAAAFLYTTISAAGPSLAAEPSAEGIEFFEKKIRPILVEQCQKCHTGAKAKGKLLLDTRAALLKGGDTGPAIVPGAPEKSLLLTAIAYTSNELRMPPKSRLPEGVVADFRAWIKMGAPWPQAGAGTTVAKEFDLAERKQFWCWQPVAKVAAPEVNAKEWVQSPIDAFVLAKLQEAGLKPAAPAEPRTLLRRVYFDLVGLPPTPEEMDAFVKEYTAKPQAALAKVVDRLLDSPHYGERWGRHWLDLMRYAETYGHEFDFEIPEAYHYRDYVIRAFNADVPYNQLVVEHVAGDLVPQPRRHPTDKFNESIVGTGFWFLHEAKHSPVDSRVDEADRIDNQIDVFSKAFLGLTVSCARCHDHKFDAISTRDYHALMGFLQTGRQQRAFIDAPERLGKPLAELREAQGLARKAAVERSAKGLQGRAEKLAETLREGRGKLAEAKASESFLHAWSLLSAERQASAKRKQLVEQMKALQTRGKDAILFADAGRDGFKEWFVTGDAFGTLPSKGGEVLSNDPTRPIGTVVAPGTVHSGLQAGKLHGVIRSPSFAISKKKIHYHLAGKGARVNLVLDGLQLIRDPIYGGLTFEVNQERPGWRSMDVSMWQGQRAYIEVIDDGPGFVALDRVVFSDDAPIAPPNRLLLQLLDDDKIDSIDTVEQRYQQLCLDIIGRWQTGKLLAAEDAADAAALLNGMLGSSLFAPGQPPAEDAELVGLLGKCKELEAKLPTPRRALAIAEGSPWTPRVYIRGNPKSLGVDVSRRYLEAIAGDHGSVSRLELAQRLTDGSDPLVARVMVNRLWHHHFGAGLVRSVDNFGVLGEKPSHPELLDYLATTFMASGGRKSPGEATDAWSIKKMHRLLVLSSTYQMSSRADDAAAAEKDPQNRLLHRMPLRRLEAETIRDAMLAVSGRLDRTAYGPSVPPHLTPHMAGRGRPGQSGPLDGAGRRSIYVGVRRNFLTPMFLAFDYPIPFTTIGRRSVSNVPAQALALMNNPFVVQQADLWAKKVLAEPEKAAPQRVAGMYLSAFGRPPTQSELTVALEFLEEQGKAYGKGSEGKAWGDFAHVLLNGKEFVLVN